MVLRALSEPIRTADRHRLPLEFVCPACGGDEIGAVHFNGRPFLGVEDGQMIQHEAANCGSVFEVVADGLRVLDDFEAKATLDGNW